MSVKTESSRGPRAVRDWFIVEMGLGNETVSATTGHRLIRAWLRCADARTPIPAELDSRIRAALRDV